MLQPHEYRVKPGTRSLTITKVNPIRTFEAAKWIGQMTPMGTVKVENPDYHPPIHYQNGHFFMGSLEVHHEIPKREVPPYILAILRQHPPVVSQPVQSPEVMSPAEVERLFGDPGYEARMQDAGAVVLDDDEDDDRAPAARRPRAKKQRRRPPRRTRPAAAAPPPELS